MATATAEKPKRRVKKVKKKRAPKAKRPDPEQMRFRDQETGEEINAVYRNLAVDKAFNTFRNTEFKLADHIVSHKELYESLKTERQLEIEKELKALNDEKKELHNEILQTEEFQHSLQRKESLAEKRERDRANLQESFEIEEETIKQNNNGNESYICQDSRNFVWSLVLGVRRALSMRKRKYTKYTEE